MSSVAEGGTVGKLKMVLLLVLLADRHFASISDLIVGVVWMRPVVLGLCGIVRNAPPESFHTFFFADL